MSVKKVKITKKRAGFHEEIPNLFERCKSWLEEHPYSILGTVAALLLITVVYWGVGSYRDSRDRNARADYAKTLKDWPGEESPDPKAMEKVVSELEKFVAKHAGSRSSLNARLDLARAYFEMHRYEDALKWSKGVLDELSSETELRPLVRYQVALTCQALGKTDEALDHWKALRSGGMSGLDREIDWYMARLYAGKREFEKSIEHYEATLKDSGAYPPTAQLQDELSAVRLKTASSSPKSEGSK